MQAEVSLRDIAVEVIRNLPPTTSVEEIMYQINLVAKVLDGLKDVEEHKTYTTAEVLQKVKSWRK